MPSHDTTAGFNGYIADTLKPYSGAALTMLTGSLHVTSFNAQVYMPNASLVQVGTSVLASGGYATATLSVSAASTVTIGGVVLAGSVQLQVGGAVGTNTGTMPVSNDDFYHVEWYCPRGKVNIDVSYGQAGGMTTYTVAPSLFYPELYYKIFRVKKKCPNEP